MKQILVVDDDPSVAKVIKATLRAYEVTLTASGDEALQQAAQRQPYDLLITDYALPGMMGDAIAARLRALHPTTKTLLITGYLDVITVDPGALDARLAKPFRPSELQHTVRQLIGQP
jgi:CheY-like chemotaxis protein